MAEGRYFEDPYFVAEGRYFEDPLGPAGIQGLASSRACVITRRGTQEVEGLPSSSISPLVGGVGDEVLLLSQNRSSAALTGHTRDLTRLSSYLALRTLWLDRVAR